jgi:hypothetical protein
VSIADDAKEGVREVVARYLPTYMLVKMWWYAEVPSILLRLSVLLARLGSRMIGTIIARLLGSMGLRF